MGFQNFNIQALDYMRQKLSEHQEFNNMDAVDRLLMLQLIEDGIKYYLEAVSRYNNQDPGRGKIH